MKQIEPQWKTRLLRDIDLLLSQVDIITEHINRNNSRKVLKKLEDIIAKYKINKTNKNLLQNLIELRDTLRQKLKVKTSRLKRYNVITLRENCKIINFGAIKNSFTRTSKRFPKNKTLKLKLINKHFWNFGNLSGRIL